MASPSMNKELNMPKQNNAMKKKEFSNENKTIVFFSTIQPLFFV